MENGKHTMNWLIDTGLKEAQYWEMIRNNIVKCLLCPRNCRIKPGEFGFCKARLNDNGELKTAIWGKMLTPSIEPIETEAVYHFWPGEKIVSVGNLGCNLSCDFCQNWESSNLENLSCDAVRYHTPESIVDLAKYFGLRVLSFTYNDPVIWFEFVYETARLARQNGITTLFKSAAYISREAAQALTDVIDVFSISLKSINPSTFSSMSKGRLEPVLDAIHTFHQSSSHLEISHLIVPGLTDNLEEIEMLSHWIARELSDEIPVHFVRFHPCYHYTKVARTDIPFLESAQQTALEAGLKYVYIGNTFQPGHGDSFCRHCGNQLVKRFGLHTNIAGLSAAATCTLCGEKQHIVLQPHHHRPRQSVTIPKNGNQIWFWEDSDARNLHLLVRNQSPRTAMLVCQHLDEKMNIIDCETLSVPGEGEVRFAVGQVVDQEICVQVNYTDDIHCKISKLLDRAHFPLNAAC